MTSRTPFPLFQVFTAEGMFVKLQVRMYILEFERLCISVTQGILEAISMVQGLYSWDGDLRLRPVNFTILAQMYEVSFGDLS